MSLSRDRCTRAALAAAALLALLAACGGGGIVEPRCPEAPGSDLRPALSCAPVEGHIRGRVVDAATGAGIVGAMVATNPVTRTAVTDGEGGFVIGVVPLAEEPATFAVTAVKAGYESASAEVTVWAGGPFAELELALTRPVEPVSVDGGTLGVEGFARVTMRVGEDVLGDVLVGRVF